MRVTFSFLRSDDNGEEAHVLQRSGSIEPPVQSDQAEVLVVCGRDQQITPQQYIAMARLADTCREYEFSGELCGYSNAVAAVRHVQRVSR